MKRLLICLLLPACLPDSRPVGPDSGPPVIDITADSSGTVVGGEGETDIGPVDPCDILSPGQDLCAYALGCDYAPRKPPVGYPNPGTCIDFECGLTTGGHIVTGICNGGGSGSGSGGL